MMMRRLLFFAVVACVSFSLQAQVYVGGSLSAWTQKSDDVKINTLTFFPEIGYSFTGNWHAGIVVGFGQTGVSGQKDTEYKVTPYVGYTFYQSDIAALFVEGGVSLLHTKPSVGDAFTGFEIGLNPGISVSLSKRLSMRAHYGFLGYRKTGVGDDSEYGLKFDFEALRFGFHYSF